MAGNLKMFVGSFSQNQESLVAVQSSPKGDLKLFVVLFSQNREALVAMQSSQRKVFGFDGDSRTFDRQRQNFYTACFVQWHCPLQLHCISQIPLVPSNAKC